jgi:hypothetical protein
MHFHIHIHIHTHTHTNTHIHICTISPTLKPEAYMIKKKHKYKVHLFSVACISEGAWPSFRIIEHRLTPADVSLHIANSGWFLHCFFAHATATQPSRRIQQGLLESLFRKGYAWVLFLAVHRCEIMCLSKKQKECSSEFFCLCTCNLQHEPVLVLAHDHFIVPFTSLPKTASRWWTHTHTHTHTHKLPTQACPCTVFFDVNEAWYSPFHTCGWKMVILHACPHAHASRIMHTCMCRIGGYFLLPYTYACAFIHDAYMHACTWSVRRFLCVQNTESTCIRVCELIPTLTCIMTVLFLA